MLEKSKKLIYGIIIGVIISVGVINILSSNVIAANKYIITYNASGGYAAPQNQTKIQGKTLILSKSIPKRTGYNFLGWATSKNANTVQYRAGANYVVNKSVTLYAVWDKQVLKTLALKFSDKHWFASVGNGHEVATVSIKYSEKCKAGKEKSIYYYRDVYYTVDLVNNSSDIETDLYMPKAVQHFDSNGSLIKKYTLDTKHSTISEPHDYIGLYSNDSTVEYSTSKKNYGQVGFTINVNGSLSWGKKLKLNLNASNNATNTAKLVTNSFASNTTSESKTNEEYYYELGKIEKELLDLNEDTSNINRFSNTEEALVNSEEKSNAIKSKEENKKLYKQAVSNGFKVSQNVVMKKISEFKREVRKTDNYNEYLSFISGTGMSEEEYWKIKFDDVQEQLTINTYLNEENTK